MHEVTGVGSLSDDELAALVRFVRALVDHDEAVLREAGAYDDGGDPYMFTRGWRLWDHVDLIMPPGEPKTWEMDVYREAATSLRPSSSTCSLCRKAGRTSRWRSTWWRAQTLPPW